MQAVEIVRIVGIARIAAGIAVAGEGVPVEAVVVAVAGAAVVAVAVEVDVTAVAMADTVATAAAEGTSRGFGIYESQNPHPVAYNTTGVGTREDRAAISVAALFFWEDFSQVSRKCSGHFHRGQKGIFSAYGIPCSGQGKFAHTRLRSS
jgi:hypothetical protein